MRQRRPRGHTQRLTVAVLGVVLAVAGCSQGGSTTATSPGPSASTAPVTTSPPPATGPLVGPTAPSTTEHLRTGGPGSTVVPQEDQLLNAVTGTWKGDAGTLTFAGDGTATFVVKDCPSPAGATGLEVALTCEPRTLRGRVSVGVLDLLLSNDQGPVADFGVYMDEAGQLHLGTGGAFPATATLQTQITLGVDKADGVITVDHDHCVLEKGTDQPKELPCQWTTRNGLKVLVVEDRVYVYEQDLGLIASPKVHFGTFTR